MRGGDVVARHHASPGTAVLPAAQRGLELAGGGAATRRACVCIPQRPAVGVLSGYIYVKQLLSLTSGVVGQLSAAALNE